MHPNIQRCLPMLSGLASAIGWDDLTPHSRGEGDDSVVWYESGESNGDDSDLFLQINELPVGNMGTFAGSVYAVRYTIWTGWHSFPCPDTDGNVRFAIERIDGWLNRQWFTDEKLRVQFSYDHPECCGYNGKRIRESSPPHGAL